MRRPSAGSGRRAIRPSLSRSEIVWVIDCGRTRSAIARSPIDLVPSRSSREMTYFGGRKNGNTGTVLNPFMNFCQRDRGTEKVVRQIPRVGMFWVTSS